MKFYFSDVVVDEALFSITKNAQKLEVEPRIFTLLVYFCRHPNIPISREQLIEHVWDSRIVSNAAINRAVSELRKLIEENPKAPTIITTISKVGYQFSITPTVEEQVSTAQDPTPQLTEAADVDSSDDADTRKRNGELRQSVAYESETAEHSVVDSNTVSHSSTLSRVRVATLLMLLVTVIGVGAWLIGQQDVREQHKVDHFSVKELPLTSLKGASFRAKYAKDGEQLLFLHKSSAKDNVNIWYQSQSHAPYQLTNDGYYYTYAIFAGEHRIIASRFNNLHQRTCEIVAIDIEKKEVTPIIDCAERAITVLAYRASTDTLYFNFRTELNTPYSIYSYHLATKRFKQITLPYSGGNLRGDYMLALSPDEKSLAVLEYQSNSTSLMKFIDLDNQHETYHQTAFSAFSNIAWLSKNTLVVADGSGLKQYGVDDQSIRVLITNRDIGYVSTNLKTGAIVFDKSDMVVNLYQAPLAKNGESNSLDITANAAITQSSFTNYSPWLANRSLKSAYVSSDKGDSTIMIRQVDGKTADTHFPATIKSIGNGHWSPNDRYLVAGLNNQLYVYDEAAAQWQSYLPDNHAIHYVHFLNDNKVLYSTDVDGDWQIWQLNLTNNLTKKITHAGGYSVQASDDGVTLYMTKFNHAGLYRHNIETGEEHIVLPEFQITSWGRWQLRGDTIYYLASDALEAYETLTNERYSVLNYAQNRPLSFSVAHDQETVFLDVTESSTANIWQMNIDQAQLSAK
ncbi:winged helix-turn-helix domain-containing protein [Thalassotalea fusca]